MVLHREIAEAALPKSVSRVYLYLGTAASAPARDLSLGW
jgi:hypothetical protein